MSTRAISRFQRALTGWLLLGLSAFIVLPWYFPQDLGLSKTLASVFTDADAASGLLQAARQGRFWLWAALFGLLIGALAVALPAGRRQGHVLLGGSLIGLAGVLAGAFAIAVGWSRSFPKVVDPDQTPGRASSMLLHHRARPASGVGG